MSRTANEYAEALFLLSKEEGLTDVILTSLGRVKALFAENPEYTELLSSPAITLGERLTVLDEAFSELPEYTLSFLKLLCENGRIRSAFECIEEYEKLVSAAQNRAFAMVCSAVPLDEEQKHALCQRLGEISGKTVDAEFTVDKSLIGGLKIEFEGKAIDGSLRHRLRDVKDVMIK